jgi:hypothetical protein
LTEQPQLHGVASIPTKSYCIDFLMLLSNANVCGTHSKRYISSIRSRLTVPNSFVKHDLKGVLKCIGVEICTHDPSPPPTDRDRHARIFQNGVGKNGGEEFSPLPLTDRDRQPQ